MSNKAMQQALEALLLPTMKTQQMLIQRDEAIIALRRALEQPEQEPVACRFCHSKNGCWTWQCYNCGEIDDVQQPAPPQQQAEPVTWDKPSDNFNDWWDSDRRRDNANPFTTDSFSYWAYEGWQAALAQRPWVGLTEEEIEVIGDKVANEDLVGLVSNFRERLARAIEAKLKEKNHG